MKIMNKKRFIGAALIASLSMASINSSYVYASQLEYSTVATLNTIKDFDVRKGFDPSLYYARSILSQEGQKAWDVALDALLKYDNSDNKYPLKNGNREVVINYKKLGIAIDAQEAQYIQKYLVRQEPRMFHLKDWGATVVTDENGIVETQSFYIGNGMSEEDHYQKTLVAIEQEVQQILSNIKEDMTIYQAIQAVQKAYEKSIRYSNTGSPSDLRGAFLAKKAICGGYTKGFEYLLLRMGIENIWVEGQAGGYHAWNHVKVNGKWYLADTTWGGQNWYLRGEVENHKANQTYHIMPTLEKEGVPYKWGQYPGVWITIEDQVLMTIGETFNPKEYIKELGDIYDSDLRDAVKIIYNDVNTQEAGSYTVIYQVENKDGQKAESELKVKVIDAERVLPSGLDKLSGNLAVQPVSLYLDGEEFPYENGLFVGEAGSSTYSIDGENIKYFEANVGINKNVRDNTAYGHYGKVQFEVYADDQLIYQSDILGWKDNYEPILVEIPENAKTIKLVNVPKGSGNNHGAWGNPVFYRDNSALTAEKENLEQLIAFADQMTDVSYVLEETHQESRFNNFVYAREYAKDIMNSGSKNVEDYKQGSAMLSYAILEVGQTYVPGGVPVRQ